MTEISQQQAMREQIAHNIACVKKKIQAAAARAGRDENEVTLIAVTKTVDAQTASYAVDAGVRNVGENRVQEYRDKREKLDSQINVHFIGQLQRNKVKYIVSDVAYIHSVDRLSLAQEIARRAEQANRPVNVLIEVAFDADENRGGVAPEALHKLAFAVQALPRLNLCGLMCVAPLGATAQQTRDCFASLRHMRDALVREGLHLPHLSMGMSGDYEIAVEEGATFVRVGTSIFGPRMR